MFGRHFGRIHDTIDCFRDLLTFLQKEHRLSFCINLEIVTLEVKIQRSFFGRIHDTIDCFRDLLTFNLEDK